MWKPEASGGTKRRDLDFTAKPETSCERKIFARSYFSGTLNDEERDKEKRTSRSHFITLFFLPKSSHVHRNFNILMVVFGRFLKGVGKSQPRHRTGC